MLEDNWRDYLYIACVRFTKQVKKGPLQETSPLINDISGVPSWEKVGSVSCLLCRVYGLGISSLNPIQGFKSIARTPKTNSVKCGPTSCTANPLEA